MNCYLGFDIGGTKCAVMLGMPREDGFTVLARRQITTDPQNWQRTLSQLFAEGEQLLAEQSETPVAAGISCGGPLNSTTGTILAPPNLPGWDNVPITAMVQECFGVPAFLQNDANACALAEWQFGAGKGSRNMVFLTFGTGMGAGLILNGRLYAGKSGMAGEVGHMRLAEDGPEGYGKCGSFEGFCSGGGLAKLGEGRFGRPITEKEIASLAAQGDETALDVFHTCAKYLGRGLSLLIDILDPEVIVIGSIFARCENLLRKTTESVIRAEALSACAQGCRIVPAALGESVGDYAALCVAKNGYEEKENAQ